MFFKLTLHLRRKDRKNLWGDNFDINSWKTWIFRQWSKNKPQQKNNTKQKKSNRKWIEKQKNNNRKSIKNNKKQQKNKRNKRKTIENK